MASAAIIGAAVAVLYCLGSGIVAVQVIALGGGAVVDINNDLVGITSPSPAIPMIVLSAVGSAVVLAFLWQQRRSRIVNGRPPMGLFAFTCVLTVMVVIGFMRVGSSFEGGTLSQGFTLGWLGWLEKAALSPSVLTVLVVGVGLSVLTATDRRRPDGTK